MALPRISKNHFHEITRFLLLIFYFVGLFPVSGLRKKSSRELRFNCKSLIFFLSILLIAGQSFAALNSLIYLLVNTPNERMFSESERKSKHLEYISLNNITDFVVITNDKAVICVLGLCSSIRLIILARSWPNLVVQIEKYEAALPPMSFKKTLKIRHIVPIIGTFSILFVFSSECVLYMHLAMFCRVNEKDSLLDSFLAYSVPFLKDVLPNGSWRLLFISVINIQKTLALNLVDILLIIICIYLINCYKEFNMFVERFKEMHPPIWNVIRMHYTKLASLVKVIDKDIGYFILISFVNNLLVICVTIFRLLMYDLPNNYQACPIEKRLEVLKCYARVLYFASELIFISIRILAVGNLAAKVQDEAKKSVIVLNNLQTCCYDNNAKRFLEELHAYTPSLSGLNFFQVSQGALMSMFASIVTYELVLIQFSTILM